MSRIFDALRRSEQEKAGAPASAPLPPPVSATMPPDVSEGAGEPPPWHDLVAAMDSQPAAFEQVEHIRCDLRGQSHFVAHSQARDVGAERFRVLSHRLSLLRQRRPLSRLLITSAVPKEGKTVVSVNLAVTLSRTSPRVCLIDADMRQPGITRALGVPLLPGLAEYLEGRQDLATGLRIVDPFGIYYLPAGHPTTNPVELLQGAQMGELLAQVSSSFDWVIFDSPPLNPFADAHRLAHLTDGVLIVVRSGVTPRDAIVQGIASLDGAFVAGVVLNASDEPRNDYHYYDYNEREPEAENARTDHSKGRSTSAGITG